jgi:hypothetical protein
LRHTQKQESTSEHDQQQKQKSEAKEFSSVEELLRHDVAETIVPPGVAIKLNESIANAPKPEAWWERFFSRE